MAKSHSWSALNAILDLKADLLRKGDGLQYVTVLFDNRSRKEVLVKIGNEMSVSEQVRVR